MSAPVLALVTLGRMDELIASSDEIAQFAARLPAEFQAAFRSVMDGSRPTGSGRPRERLEEVAFVSGRRPRAFLLLTDRWLYVVRPGDPVTWEGTQRVACHGAVLDGHDLVVNKGPGETRFSEVVPQSAAKSIADKLAHKRSRPEQTPARPNSNPLTMQW